MNKWIYGNTFKNVNINELNEAAINKRKIGFLTKFGILAAILAIVSFTPLGSIPFFGFIVVTISMIPVVVTSILLGTIPGALMGLLAGLFSLIVWTFMPPMPAIAFAFSPFHSFGEVRGGIASLLICLVPRIFVGLGTGFLFQILSKVMPKKNEKITSYIIYGVSGAFGSMLNTLMVLGGIYMFFQEPYSAAIEISADLLLGIIVTTILTGGIPEAALAAIAAIFICKPLKNRI